jgi:homoserine dehydrogenase
MSHYKLAFLGFGNVGKALADLLRSRVSPQMVGIDSPLYGVDGTTSILQIESDVLGKLSLIEEDPGPHTTAYGLLADFLNAVR